MTVKEMPLEVPVFESDLFTWHHEVKVAVTNIESIYNNVAKNKRSGPKNRLLLHAEGFLKIKSVETGTYASFVFTKSDSAKAYHFDIHGGPIEMINDKWKLIIHTKQGVYDAPEPPPNIEDLIKDVIG